jgi:hypothetical protein
MRPLYSSALVTTAHALYAEGVSRTQLETQLAARRWRRDGRAIVLHNGPLSPDQRRSVALIHAGPKAVFTAFTAAELLGLEGWARKEVHVLAPAGTRVRGGCSVPLRLHLHGNQPIRRAGPRTIEALPDALLRAAATFGSARPGCGILAASVQQKKATADDLAVAIDRSPRIRHRALLRLAVADIAGGSEALSEIDFVRLCRRNGLPAPAQQLMRRERSGRRRYLDASWIRSDGRLIVVEVDGALHLAPRRWWDDQLRQNEIALTDAMVLRYPSVILRTDEALVAGQLRRALRL